MIKIENLSKSYFSGNVETKALKNVSFEIADGEFVAIMGKSGCGKSTLLNILGGMDTQTEGTYIFDGEDVSRFKGKQLAKFRNEKIGFVFQSFYLLNDINSLQNIGLPMGIAGKSKKERTERADELLRLVELPEKAKQKPCNLSGGQQQRVSIARALSNNPKILLADEPTGNLDEENGKKIIEIFKALNEKGLTVIMVTHDPDMAKNAKRIIKMSDGKIVGEE